LGKLVQFDKRRFAAKSEAPKPGESQVVIFTGVRYERRAVAPEPGKPPASTGPKRKRG
jgi:hypothetical protein